MNIHAVPSCTHLKKICSLIALLLVLLPGCSDPTSHSKAAYVLIDISSDYAVELQKARTLTNYLLANLNSGDSLSVAFTDHSSFTERNIIAQTTFDFRPSVTNQQKRVFQAQVDKFVDGFRVPSHHNDITGGILLASDYLSKIEAGQKYLFILSDLREDLPPWVNRDMPVNLTGIRVVAVNVKRQRSDNNNPQQYQKRISLWQQRVESGGGAWQLVDDLARLDKVLVLR